MSDSLIVAIGVAVVFVGLICIVVLCKFIGLCCGAAKKDVKTAPSAPVVAQNNFFLPPTSVTTLVTETDSKGFSHFRAVGVGDISHLYPANEPMSQSGLYPDFEE